jgi:PAS domain S-box-containing protein
MDDATPTRVGWRDVVAAVPGAAAVSIDGTFACVSEDLASLVDREADALAGASWRPLCDAAEAGRLEDAVAVARADGEWTGTVTLEEAEGPRELALSRIDDDATLWVLRPDDRDGAEPGRRASGRETRLYDRPGFVRNVLDAIEDVLYVIDEDGESYLWNETLVETTGYGHEEIEAMAPEELIPEDQHEYVPGLMAAIADTEDRRVTVDIVTKDGERRPHEFRGTTVTDPETGRHYRCGLARDVSERLARERELERYETIVETVDDGVYALDEDLRFVFVNDALCDLLGLDREELLGTDAETLFVSADERSAAVEMRRRVVDGDSDVGTVQATVQTGAGERLLEARYRLHPEPVDRYRGSVGVIRDVTEREERERTLERQRDALATLDRINELLLETTREVIQTASREAVEAAVCEQLASSELYRFAWVGEPAFDGEELVRRATAGEADGYLEAVVITTDDSETGRGPAGRAMATGEVQVADVDDPSFEPWREAARERGFESVAAVPLQDDGTVYGVLVVYATREDAFGDRERSGFDVLGRTVGAVIHAAKNRELLFADAVVELEFRVDDGDSTYVAAAAALGCELALEGYVSAGERWVLYFEVDGATPAEVVDAVAGDPGVDRARILTAGDGGGRVELVVDVAPLLEAVSAAGGIVRSASVDGNGVDVVVEAPVDADIREIGERVTEAVADATLLARRHRDREVTRVGQPGGMLDELTPRQRDVLEVAYRAGYFAWPRDSTAEEVAGSLDLAPATLHAHLRKAEAAILSRLFENRRGES